MSFLWWKHHLAQRATNCVSSKPSRTTQQQWMVDWQLQFCLNHPTATLLSRAHSDWVILCWLRKISHSFCLSHLLLISIRLRWWNSPEICLFLCWLSSNSLRLLLSAFFRSFSLELSSPSHQPVRCLEDVMMQLSLGVFFQEDASVERALFLGLGRFFFPCAANGTILFCFCQERYFQKKQCRTCAEKHGKKENLK